MANLAAGGPVKYHPSLNLQGETCCCFIELRAGVMMITAVTIVSALTQWMYEAKHGNEWWLWLYVGLCSSAALIGFTAAWLYKPTMCKIYIGWLIVSAVIWIVDGVLYADDMLGFGLTFGVVLTKLYFVYIVWKFAKALETKYGRLSLDADDM